MLKQRIHVSIILLGSEQEVMKVVTPYRKSEAA